MVTKSDFPKTTRYRGKVYGTHPDLHYDTKKRANEVAKQHKKDRIRNGINFFTVIKEFTKPNGKPVFVVYWRGTYSKASVKRARKNKPSNYK